jgi:hypothetical protein
VSGAHKRQRRHALSRSEVRHAWIIVTMCAFAFSHASKALTQRFKVHARMHACMLVHRPAKAMASAPPPHFFPPAKHSRRFDTDTLATTGFDKPLEPS